MANYTIRARVTTDYEASFEADDEDDVQSLVFQLTPGDFDDDDIDGEPVLEILYVTEED